MGLEDLTESEKESFNEIDEDDVEEFRDQVDELTEKIRLLSKIAVNMDGRMENVREDMQAIDTRLKHIESIVLHEEDGSGDGEGGDLFNELEDDGPSWGE